MERRARSMRSQRRSMVPILGNVQALQRSVAIAARLTATVQRLSVGEPAVCRSPATRFRPAARVPALLQVPEDLDIAEADGSELPPRVLLPFASVASL